MNVEPREKNETSTKPRGVPSSWIPFTKADFIHVVTENLSELLKLIEGGLPMSALEHFQTKTNLPMARVAKLIRIPPRTLARRREEGRLSAEESDRLVRISRLFAATTNLFSGNVADAVDWLSKPLRALGGAVPLEVAETEAGCHAIEQVVMQLEHGVFP